MVSCRRQAGRCVGEGNPAVRRDVVCRDGIECSARAARDAACEEDSGVIDGGGGAATGESGGHGL